MDFSQVKITSVLFYVLVLLEGNRKILSEMLCASSNKKHKHTEKNCNSYGIYKKYARMKGKGTAICSVLAFSKKQQCLHRVLSLFTADSLLAFVAEYLKTSLLSFISPTILLSKEKNVKAQNTRDKHIFIVNVYTNSLKMSDVYRNNIYNTSALVATNLFLLPFLFSQFPLKMIAGVSSLTSKECFAISVLHFFLCKALHSVQ